ncbi:uncharacterized protein [Procambarus clarkii]|uniref:uncharacterized protein n=1 Tax=Procambarus clarkii TaxID=6728 RepID=UPI0037438869
MASQEYDQVKDRTESYRNILLISHTDQDELNLIEFDLANYEDKIQDKLDHYYKVLVTQNVPTVKEVDHNTAEWMTKIIIQRKLSGDLLIELYTYQNGNVLSMQDIFAGQTLRSVRPKSTTSAPKRLKSPISTPKSPIAAPQSTTSTHKRIINKQMQTAKPSQPVVAVSPKTVTPKRTVRWGLCLFCNQKHSLCKCTNYPNRDTRVRRLNQLHRCTRCLKSHNVNSCEPLLNTCNKCRRGKHHAALCKFVKTNYLNPRIRSRECTSVQCCKVREVYSVISPASQVDAALSTAKIQVKNKRIKISTRGLFDQGSQRTFITQKAAEALNLKPITQTKLNLSGLMINRRPQEYSVVQPLVRLGGYTKVIQAIFVDQIPFDLNIKSLRYTAKFLQEHECKLADN